jgi:hypothetical protein
MIIFSHRGASWEGWLSLNAGKLIYHYEDDGHRYLRRGVERMDEELTLEQALERFPQYAGQIKAAVKVAE